MAYGLPYDSYTPHPSIPGAAYFNPAGGGNPMLFGGQDAAQLQAMIDRSPKPQMLAMGGQPPASMQAPPAPLPVKADVQPAMAAPAPAPTAQQLPTRSVIPGGEAAQAAPAAGVPPGPQLSDLDKGYKIVHTKAGWTPSSQKVVTEGSMAQQSPELAAATTQAFADKMRADASSAEAQKLALAHQVQQSQLAATQAAQEADALEKKRIAQLAAQEEGAKEYGRITDIKQKELEQQGAKGVDQFRMYRGKAGAQIGAAIAGALGAFGAAFTHGPNFALDIINKQIDNDVLAQREEIARGVNAKQNDLARIRDKYQVDNNIAEKLLSISLTERAQALARKQAALQGGQEAMQRLAQIDSELAAKKVADLKAVQDMVLGKAQVTAEEKYRQGGDSVLLNPEIKGREAVAEATGKTSTALGAAAKGEYEATHGGQAPPKAGTTGALPAKMKSLRAINHSAQEDIIGADKEDPGGFIAPAGPAGVATDARRQLDASADAIAAKIVAGSGESMTEAGLEHMKAVLSSPYESVRKAARKHFLQAAQTASKNIESEAGSATAGTNIENANE